MSLVDSIIGGAYNFLLYAGFTAIITGVIIILSYPIWIKKLFPIPFIVLKNAGGAKDNSNIVLDHKIIKRGRRINTAYGDRVKILGVKHTQPLSIVSRENAIPWEAGGVAYMIYEKEIGQFSNIKPKVHDLHLFMQKREEKSEKVKKIYEWLIDEHNDLAECIKIVTPKTLVAPVTFHNQSVFIRPFPADLVTPTMYDMKIRMERVQRIPEWQKWAPYAVMLLLLGVIVAVGVLSYEQINKSGASYLEQMEGQREGLAESIASRMKGSETPPGGIMIPLLPFLYRKKRRPSG